MGGYLSRNRAWVYIAFYDEYVGRHINTSAGLSILFMIPMYWYGVHVNRVKEQNYAALYYNWTHCDKRNRLTHNMIMEHFETHVEDLQDLVVDLQKHGGKVWSRIPPPIPHEPITIDDLAVIDEISGLRAFIDNYLSQNRVPEHIKSKLQAKVIRYQGAKSFEEAKYDLYKKTVGY